MVNLTLECPMKPKIGCLIALTLRQLRIRQPIEWDN